jgi:hypothetical protein
VCRLCGRGLGSRKGRTCSSLVSGDVYAVSAGYPALLFSGFSVWGLRGVDMRRTKGILRLSEETWPAWMEIDRV